MEFTATAVLSIVLPNKTRKPDVFLRSCSIVGGGGGGGVEVVRRCWVNFQCQASY